MRGRDRAGVSDEGSDQDRRRGPVGLDGGVRGVVGSRRAERANGACSPTAASCRSTSSTTLQFAGGGSEADASNAPLAEASGTGACLSTASSTNPCPTSATSSLSGLASTTTQDAVAKGDGVTATPTGSSSCAVPLDTGLIDVNVSCGTASASEDANGNPTASGTGSLANVSISLSLTDVLQSLLGGSLPSASSVCNDVPAAVGRGRLQHRTRWRRACSRC